ncbi:MAG: CAP domain-containing protein, partial [Akkermansiaceae bacterium]|nr:CAP domain-containing protein [Akkermansiaceae bacterium]
MRLLVGLPALELDPKLCEASRGHSEDMSKLGFFSHTSPVPGKATPSDRARRAGTSGGAENIYTGSRNPEAANKGWFYSPGHHKNMFNPGYRRIGL